MEEMGGRGREGKRGSYERNRGIKKGIEGENQGGLKRQGQI